MSAFEPKRTFADQFCCVAQLDRHATISGARPERATRLGHTERYRPIPRSSAGRFLGISDSAQNTMSENTAIRPFQVSFPEAELSELRRRVKILRKHDGS